LNQSVGKEWSGGESFFGLTCDVVYYVIFFSNQGDGKEWSGAASKGYATFLDVLRAEVKDFMADS